MNCRDFKKFIGAFADGELDTQKNLEALEHLNMCERCAAKVADIQLLKRSLARVFTGERAAEALRDRVLNALASESVKPVDQATRQNRWVVPLGMAAAIAFVWIGYPFVAGPGASRRPGRVTAIEAQVVRSVVGRHFGCIKLGPSHHRSSLPRELDGIKSILGKELGFPVIVPDLSNAGFRLHSADNCGLEGMPGAHIVYQRTADNMLVSVFSVRRIDTLASAQGDDPGRRRCIVCNVKSPAAVVGWHGDKTTYLMCGNLPPPELLALARSVE